MPHAFPRPARRPAPGRIGPWMLLALLGALAAGLWWWHGHGPASPAQPAQPAAGAASAAASGRRFGGAGAAQPVSVGEVRRQDLSVSVSAIGSLAASNTAVVRAQVSGVVQSLNFRDGQPVQAGQLLAQLDARALQASLAQAEGVLARDQAQLAGARTDLARYRDLLGRDAIPKQQLDTQATLVGQLEGTVKADQATVDNARLQLSYTRVTAPIAGRAGFKQVDLGNMAGPNDPNGIVSIVQTRPMALSFSLPAAHLALLRQRLHDRAALPVQALERGSDRVLAEGVVAAVDNAIDPSTDTLRVKALFPNTDDALFPNQAVNVRLQLDTLLDALAVPKPAVLRGAQGFCVYLVRNDGTVTARPVKPGAEDGGWVAVDGELQPGDRVVIDGSDRLREGGKVEVIDAARRAGGAGDTPAAGREHRHRPPEGAAGDRASAPGR